MFNLKKQFIHEYGIDKKIIKESSDIIKRKQILSIDIFENHELPGTDGYVATVVFKQDSWISISSVLSTIVIFFKTEVYDYEFEDTLIHEADAFLVAALSIIDNLKIKNLPFYYRTPEMESIIETKKAMDVHRTEELLDSFKIKFENEIKSSSLFSTYFIIAYIENNFDSPMLKFKISETDKKPCSIKNIGNFLLDITENNTIEYGKNLIVNHNENFFDEDSQKIINFIRKAKSSILKHNNITLNRFIKLSPALLDSWFELALTLSSKNLSFYIKESTKIPKIIIDEFDDSYIINAEIDEDGDEFFCGAKHLYSIDHKILTRIKLDLSGKAVDFLKELFVNGTITVLKEKFDEFYLYILSDMNDFLDIIGYEPKVNTEQNINIYIDVNDFDQVFVKIDYIYENQTNIIGFDPANKELSIRAKKVENYISSISEIDTKDSIAYIKDIGSNIKHFVNHGVIYLQQYATVYMSESIKRIGTKSKMSMSVGVTVKNNLLEINLDSVDIPKEELVDILDSYKQKKKFHRLKNGEQIYLNDEALEETEKMLERYRVNTKNIKNGSFEVDLFRIFDINQNAISNDSLTFDRSKVFHEIINRFKNLENKRYTLIPHYEDLLRDYQKHGYNWIRTLADYGFGGILADDMGLGKTLQVISILDTIDKSDKKISIVIAPASLILNWEDEITKFSKDLKVIVIHGSAKKRESLLKTKDEYNLIITSYDYIKLDTKLYQDINFEYIVLDEAQYIKNQKTKGALAVKSLIGKHRLALTGTPIENSLAELWSIFDFLMPGYLYPYAYFSKEFEKPIIKNKDEKLQIELRKLISPFILRRVKKDVLSELPKKIETVIPVEFSPEEKKLYLANLSQVNDDLASKLKIDNVNAIAILAMLTRLRQICCEPRVLFENIDKPSSKIEACVELIQNLKDSGKKVLLFSSFTSVLDLIKESLEKRNISNYILTGSTDKVKRRELVADFQEDDTTVFLISLKAGGTGLNLTAAEAVIHFDPWWNMSAQNQATDRVHRIGQKNTVSVYKLIMKDSIEEKIQQLQEAKKDLADAFVEGNDGRITSMSREDIMELFK